MQLTDGELGQRYFHVHQACSAQIFSFLGIAVSMANIATSEGLYGNRGEASYYFAAAKASLAQTFAWLGRAEELGINVCEYKRRAVKLHFIMERLRRNEPGVFSVT